MLYALSLAHADVYSAEDAPANGAPFLCPRCLSRVFLRCTAHQRPHWTHGPTHSDACALRRDAVSGQGHIRRTAAEIETYAPTGAN